MILRLSRVSVGDRRARRKPGRNSRARSGSSTKRNSTKRKEKTSRQTRNFLRGGGLVDFKTILASLCVVLNIFMFTELGLAIKRESYYLKSLLHEHILLTFLN
jgi:hypothetical protein